MSHFLCGYLLDNGKLTASTALAYLFGDVVERIETLDGTKFFELIRRHDGLWCFWERTADWEEITGDYWRDTFDSGFYPDREAAKADALLALSWLSEPHKRR